MIFWRNKNNASDQDREKREEKIMHPPKEPAIEPPVEYDAELDASRERELIDGKNEAQMLADDLDVAPVPGHTRLLDAKTAERERLHDEEEEGGGWLSRLTKGLSKSSGKIGQGITDLLTKSKLDEAALEGLEETLIAADLGPKTAAKIVEAFGQSRFGKAVSEEDVKTALALSIENILAPVAGALEIRKPADGPFVVLVAGVNGVGKTTTIGKIAHDLHVRRHLKVMMAAGDTFRAAAIEQLEIWAKRTHCHLLAKEVGADAASVAFEAYEKARAEGVDVLLIDTAGRLHNKANLMAELEKIVRVLKKQNPDLPHEVLLVLDGTTGQNAHAQVETFKSMIAVTGLVVTKLDGSARGGVVVSLADAFGLPIYAVGVGETAEDLQPFHPAEYARSLVGLPG